MLVYAFVGANLNEPLARDAAKYATDDSGKRPSSRASDNISRRPHPDTLPQLKSYVESSRAKAP